MAQIVEIVNHIAGATTTYAAPVGKRIFGFTNVRNLDIHLTIDGINVTLLSNMGERQLMLPCPIEPKAAATISIIGTSSQAVGIIRDE